MTTEVVCNFGKCIETNTLRARMDEVFENDNILLEIEKDLLDDQLW